MSESEDHTEARREIAVSKFRDFLTSIKMERPGSCPFCGANQWALIGFSESPLYYAPEPEDPEDSVIPIALVACGNCKLVLQFAAKPMGLIE